uniref:DNA2/NAM7 helicase-like C-terminal domain-containing protein n=1 Tax=Neobodo designis TaxID=312471 RepID=A0A7S1MJM0_NEODS|mmetsp:Transcript_40575/g.125346  ORF Transcript_40575/g.125346 Transcript_40575/m.125346 type:complete len:1193 (+) Transcript_40575:30-3608(+)
MVDDVDNGLAQQLAQLSVTGAEGVTSSEAGEAAPASRSEGRVCVSVIDIKSSSAGMKPSHKMQVAFYAAVLRAIAAASAKPISFEVNSKGYVWTDPATLAAGDTRAQAFGAIENPLDTVEARDTLLVPWFADTFWPRVISPLDVAATEGRQFDKSASCGQCPFRNDCAAIAWKHRDMKSFGLVEPSVRGGPERELCQLQSDAMESAVARRLSVVDNGRMSLAGQLRHFAPGALRHRVEGSHLAVVIADDEGQRFHIVTFRGWSGAALTVFVARDSPLAEVLAALPVPSTVVVADLQQRRAVAAALRRLSLTDGHQHAAIALRRFFLRGAGAGDLTTTLAALPTATDVPCAEDGREGCVAAVDAAACAFAFPIPTAAVGVAEAARFLLPPDAHQDRLFVPSDATAPTDAVRVHGAVIRDSEHFADVLARIVSRVEGAYPASELADALPVLPEALIAAHAELLKENEGAPTAAAIATVAEARAYSEAMSLWAHRGVPEAASSAVPVVGRLEEPPATVDKRSFAWLTVALGDTPGSACFDTLAELTAGLELVEEEKDGSHGNAERSMASIAALDDGGFFDGALRCLKVYRASDKGTPCLYLSELTAAAELESMTVLASRGRGTKQLVVPVAWRRHRDGSAALLVCSEGVSHPWDSPANGQPFVLLPRAHRFNLGKIREALGKEGADGLAIMHALLHGRRPAAKDDARARAIGAVPSERVPTTATEPQRRFLRRLTDPDPGCFMTLLWGPPGTGKTTTLAMGLQALAAGRVGKRSLVVLVAAVTHKAKNEVYRKLCRRLKRDSRLNDGDDSKDLSVHVDGTTVVFATAYSAWKNRKTLLHGYETGVLVVDEASQMPLDVAALLFGARRWDRVAVAGDVLQLPPIEDGQRVDGAAIDDAVAASTTPALSSPIVRALCALPQLAAGSIMEALLFDNDGTRLPWTTLATMASADHPPGLIQLTTSFRSVPRIVALLRAQMYPGLEHASGTTASSATAGNDDNKYAALHAFDTIRCELPVPLPSVDAETLRIPPLRAAEARAVATHVCGLLDRFPGIRVGVVTVHRDQRREIRARLPAHTLVAPAAAPRDAADDGAARANGADDLDTDDEEPQVTVNTVEKMQGQEYDAVVVALAAVRPAFALQRRRINVAVSRAKRHVCLAFAPGLLAMARSSRTATDDTRAAADFVEAFGNAAHSPIE